MDPIRRHFVWSTVRKFGMAEANETNCGASARLDRFGKSTLATVARHHFASRGTPLFYDPPAAVDSFVAEVFGNGLLADLVNFGRLDFCGVHFEAAEVVAEVNHATFADQWHHVVDQWNSIGLYVPVLFGAFAVGIRGRIKHD